MLEALAIAVLLAAPAELTWRDLVADDFPQWTTTEGEGTFTFDRGELHGSGPSSRNVFLVSPDIHRDFVLECEVLAEAGSNSGIQIRSHINDQGRLSGPQVEIETTDRRWSGGLYDEGRRGWLDPLEGDEEAMAAFRIGEWNHYRIECLGPRYRTWVNGRPCTDFMDVEDLDGHIAFQIHGGAFCDVRWRNIRIADLGDVDVGPSDAVDAVPTNAEVLFDGTSLAGWSHDGWALIDGAMEVAPGSGNLLTNRPLGSGILHVEFRTPLAGLLQLGQKRGNSGVYLQGRYEVQILDSPWGPADHRECGAIYGVAPPRVNAARESQRWQSYLIHFQQPLFDETETKSSPAVLTVYHNGILIHDQQPVGFSTGSGKAELPGPAPLLLQDHGNLVRFRNIWWVPLS